MDSSLLSGYQLLLPLITSDHNYRALVADLTCPICLGIAYNKPMVTPCCRQLFCLDCISRWLSNRISSSNRAPVATNDTTNQYRNTCPLDRQPLWEYQLLAAPMAIINLLNAFSEQNDSLMEGIGITRILSGQRYCHIICYLCNNVLQEPVLMVCCAIRLCTNCASDSCPACATDKPTTRPPNARLLAELAQLNIRCKYYGTANRCLETGPLADILAHESSCDRKPMIFCQYCGGNHTVPDINNNSSASAASAAAVAAGTSGPTDWIDDTNNEMMKISGNIRCIRYVTQRINQLTEQLKQMQTNYDEDMEKIKRMV